MGVTDYMKNDIEGAMRLKGRFIPWLGEIPPSGMINLADWQKDKAKEIQTFQQDIVTQMPNAPEKTSQVQDSPLITAEPAPKPVTEADRLTLIMGAMPKLQENDFTKSEPKIPTVASLNKITGLNDISGPERENAFAQFMKSYPNWKPAPVTE